MLSRKGGYIPYELAVVIERQKWIAAEQAKSRSPLDPLCLLGWTFVALVAIGAMLSLAGCDGDVTVYGTPRTINERELAKDKEKEQECKMMAPAKPDC